MKRELPTVATARGNARVRTEPTEAIEAVRFGAFTLIPSSRKLFSNGASVRLGARTVELLSVLVARAGSVVSKQDLFDLVWPNLAVEESNLRVHIAALRRSLGDSRSGSRYIASLPGRGYAFVAPVEHVRVPAGDLSAPTKPGLTHEAPNLLTPLLGRDQEIEHVTAKLNERRFVTITGPGGIGKTVLALAVVGAIADRFADGVLFVDLGPLDSAKLVVAQVAALMGIPAHEALPLGDLLAHVQGREFLLVLDNCEHLVSAANDFAEAVLQASARARVLATSREVLRGRGEWVERLGPLPAPPPRKGLTAAEALAYPAVQLLVERLRACLGAFELTDDKAGDIASLCVRLDGLPLAIELAATRIPTIGLQAMLSRLDEPFSILTRGRRSAAPRHQSLTALIDWSYGDLPPEEKTALRRLAVFSGRFGADAAAAVMQDMATTDLLVADLLDRLFEKSLLSLEIEENHVGYRMLETVRLYALERLKEAGEWSASRRAHASYFLHLCREKRTSLIEPGTKGWSGSRGRYAADLRAALAWCFADQGDLDLGIRLTAASASYWFKLLLVPELREHLDRALNAAAPDTDQSVLLALHVAMAHALFHTLGPIDDVRHHLLRALDLARQLGDLQSELSILWAIFGADSTKGDLVAMTEPIEAVAALRGRGHDDLVEPLFHRVSALGEHLLGRQAEAAEHAERALSRTATARNSSKDGSFVYDHRTATNSHKARTLWVQGYWDEAVDLVHETLSRASSIDQPFAMGYFLIFGACPVALWSGDWPLAAELVEKVEEVTSGTAFNVWKMNAQVYQRVLDSRLLDAGRAAAARSALVSDPSITPYLAQSLVTFDWRLLRADCLAAAETGPPIWSTAEVFRAQGEHFRSQLQGPTQAESWFRRAIRVAEEQGARAWKLRAAVSLAGLWEETGDHRAARGLLEQSLQEVRATRPQADLHEAQALLERLA